MKKILQKVFSKMTITALLIIIQVAWFMGFFYKIAKYDTLIGGALIGLSVIMLMLVVVSNQNPSYKISWIVLIGIMPKLGGIFYLLLGNQRPTRRFFNTVCTEEERLSGFINQSEEIVRSIDEQHRLTAEYIYNYGKFPVHSNTGATYFKTGEEMYESMIEDMKKAQKFIFFEFYILSESYMWQGIKKIFIEKAKAGVDIRIMYDDIGSMSRLPEKFKKELESYGIKVVPFNPFVPIASLVMNHRNHRKILVVDGNIGYNGGINIADEYINKTSPYGYWKDTGVRIEGDAVNNLSIMFLQLWNVYRRKDEDYNKFLYEYSDNKDRNKEYMKGFVQPFSDSPLDNETVGENLYMEILWKAKDYVYIFTPYMIMDNELTTALCMAAKRGVDVRLVVPGKSDNFFVHYLTKSHFKELIKVGVKIYEYTPGMIHAKSYISDDKIAVVGTINMDYRSLYLHFECGTILYDMDILKDIKQDYMDTFAESKLVKEEEIKQGRTPLILSAVLKLLSPLF